MDVSRHTLLSTSNQAQLIIRLLQVRATALRIRTTAILITASSMPSMRKHKFLPIIRPIFGCYANRSVYIDALFFLYFHITGRHRRFSAAASNTPLIEILCVGADQEKAHWSASPGTALVRSEIPAALFRRICESRKRRKRRNSQIANNR